MPAHTRGSLGRPRKPSVPDVQRSSTSRDQLRMSVVGVPVSVVDLRSAARTILRWAREDESRTVFVRDVPSLMLTADDERLRALHDDASMIVPDGAPLALLGRLRGFGRAIGRVPGADLVEAVCRLSVAAGHRHYFYGGKPGVAEEMARRLAARYPGLVVAGTFSPPMREIGPDFEIDAEVGAELAAIRESGADFIWVGLSSPKQEFWMMKAAPLVGGGVFLGVGAAFDFHAGTVRRAPRWMRDNGLEWLHRLISEPKRLWRRYLVLAPRFIGSLLVLSLTDRMARESRES